MQVHRVTMSASIFLILILKSNATRTVHAYQISMVRETESAASVTAMILKDTGKKNHNKKEIQVLLDYTD